MTVSLLACGCGAVTGYKQCEKEDSYLVKPVQIWYNMTGGLRIGISMALIIVSYCRVTAKLELGSLRNPSVYLAFFWFLKNVDFLSMDDFNFLELYFPQSLKSVTYDRYSMSLDVHVVEYLHCC
jgi:hypothetical protein